MLINMLIHTQWFSGGSGALLTPQVPPPPPKPLHPPVRQKIFSRQGQLLVQTLLPCSPSLPQLKPRLLRFTQCHLGENVACATVSLQHVYITVSYCRTHNGNALDTQSDSCTPTSCISVMKFGMLWRLL